MSSAGDRDDGEHCAAKEARLESGAPATHAAANPRTDDVFVLTTIVAPTAVVALVSSESISGWRRNASMRDC